MTWIAREEGEVIGVLRERLDNIEAGKKRRETGDEEERKCALPSGLRGNACDQTYE